MFVPACGGFYTSPSGSFSSPLYSSKYPPNQDCVYIISTTDGYLITFIFLYVQLQAGTSGCDNDYLIIYTTGKVKLPTFATVVGGLYLTTCCRLRITSSTTSPHIELIPTRNCGYNNSRCSYFYISTHNNRSKRLTDSRQSSGCINSQIACPT